MENPFKPNDKVLTKIKGADVEATVAQVFNNEVQVKTAGDKLLWRTMHTVWPVGGSPIPKPEKPKPVVTPEPAPVAPAAPAENNPQPDVVPPVEPGASFSTEAPASSETGSAVESTGTPGPVAQPVKGGKRRNARKPKV